MNQTVKHFLSIYTLKKKMMDDGITSPNKEGRNLITQLIKRLTELDPKLPCYLTTSTDSENNHWYTFTVNNEVIARVKVDQIENA